jgi:hypothetical protein
VPKRRGNTRLKVVEPLQLMSVVRHGRRLRVVARDAAERRHLLLFRVPSLTTALWHEFVMTGWAQDARTIAYVYGDRSGAQVDVGALLARAG